VELAKIRSVPSQNLPVSSIGQRKQQVRNVRPKKLVSHVEVEDVNIFDEHHGPTPEELEAAHGLLELVNIPKAIVKPIEINERGTQVSSGDFVQSFTSFIDSNSKLSTLCGITSIDVLDKITSLALKHFEDNRQHKLNFRDRIILTFMKLKQAMSYAVLAILFNLLQSSIRSLFLNTVTMLSSILRPLIYWPSKEEILSNMSLCFENFKLVRIVLNCTDIAVQKPKCLCCRIKYYSHYKGRETVKIMTDVSPTGLITFVSQAYGGRASDKAIFEQSNLIQKLRYIFRSCNG
jgi:hypothetical protein